MKTRRGRGKDSVLEDIAFDHIIMDHVMTPFVVNSFYFCDPDGMTEYVQSREALPVDDKTPEIKELVFTNIKASNCHVAASFLCGLPEQKIKRIELENVDISFAEDAKAGVPAMMGGVEACSKQGFTVMNVDTLVCRNVTISGQVGEAFIADNINHFETE